MSTHDAHSFSSRLDNGIYQCAGSGLKGSNRRCLDVRWSARLLLDVQQGSSGSLFAGLCVGTDAGHSKGWLTRLLSCQGRSGILCLPLSGHQGQLQGMRVWWTPCLPVAMAACLPMDGLKGEEARSRGKWLAGRVADLSSGLHVGWNVGGLGGGTRCQCTGGQRKRQPRWTRTWGGKVMACLRWSAEAGSLSGSDACGMCCQGGGRQAEALSGMGGELPAGLNGCQEVGRNASLRVGRSVGERVGGSRCQEGNRLAHPLQGLRGTRHSHSPVGGPGGRAAGRSHGLVRSGHASLWEDRHVSRTSCRSGK